MFYTSTRDRSVRVSAAQAIVRGISADGGLFVPEEIPALSAGDIQTLAAMDYIGRAKAVLKLYLTDFTDEEIARCVEGAYASGKFSDEKVAPLVELYPGTHILELWKGPTCAFKDMALQLLPHLLTVSAGKAAQDKKIVILVATSGDTGKAALEGFRDVPNTDILVFYPDEGVSPVQKLQMTTQEGANVRVCAIKGNFDDAQNGVKAIFTDKDLIAALEEKNAMFSSANSINWGRLVPQIVYYVSSYCELVASGKIAAGDGIDIAVPTGNFGNILAAYYAMRMGIPVRKLICASNANDVLTEFLQTGTYNRKRSFYTTISPSMDILISSNLERLLFELAGQDAGFVKQCMAELESGGAYTVRGSVLDAVRSLFAAGCCDDALTKQTIAAVFEQYGYLCDTHTAVAVRVFEDYRRSSGDDTVSVIASTASPFKFSASVLSALKPEITEGADEFAMLEELAAISGMDCPPALAELKDKPERFSGSCTKQTMRGVVLDMLGM